MSAPRRIGILGGMGPEATVLLMSRLIAATPAQDDADHIPLIVDMNTQVPSRIAALIEGGGADPAPVLAAMAKRLEAAGAEALAMPCNTAHHYAPAIRAAATVPFLDMVALSAAQAASRGRTGRPGRHPGLARRPSDEALRRCARSSRVGGDLSGRPECDARGHSRHQASGARTVGNRHPRGCGPGARQRGCAGSARRLLGVLDRRGHARGRVRGHRHARCAGRGDRPVRHERSRDTDVGGGGTTGAAGQGPRC